MASVNTIALQVSAEKRLARVVKAAVAVVARESGVPEGRAAAFAVAVARRFADLAGKNAIGSTVSISLEPGPSGLSVRLEAGSGRRPAVLEVHAGKEKAVPRARVKAGPKRPRGRAPTARRRV
jgi:hypothetical protein